MTSIIFNNDYFQAIELFKKNDPDYLNNNAYLFLVGRLKYIKSCINQDIKDKHKRNLTSYLKLLKDENKKEMRINANGILYIIPVEFLERIYNYV